MALSPKRNLTGSWYLPVLMLIATMVSALFSVAIESVCELCLGEPRHLSLVFGSDAIAFNIVALVWRPRITYQLDDENQQGT